MIGRREVKSGLESFGLAEGADDYGGVLMLASTAKLRRRMSAAESLAGEIGEGSAKLGESGEGGFGGRWGRRRRAGSSGGRLRGRRAEGIDEAVGGVAGDDVNLHDRPGRGR